MRHLLMGGGVGGMGAFFLRGMIHRVIMHAVMLLLIVAVIFFWFKWQQEKSRNRDLPRDWE